ncbi:hypothetical protein [Amycolatopsis suaedae]|uniref:Uncharacterized protein n=1 Tax=Amycolatopsis suaedae TaxID=2510978 RepID=A0A4Q7J5I9_9PSEU|nr:hypothetical protein [Amycolatopsis suaedae]RZQ62369.1 hypothetical protein EWH70_19045 [Amycolatopsis suaedae]
MLNTRKIITGAAAVLALGLAGGLPATAAAAAEPVAAASDKCAHYLIEARKHEDLTKQHLAAAKKAAQAGDQKKAKYHRDRAASHKALADRARDQYRKCRS